MHWELMQVFLLQEYYREYRVGRQKLQDKSQYFGAKKKVYGSEIIVSSFESHESRLSNCRIEI